MAVRWDKRCLYLLEVTRPYDSKVGFADRSDRLKLSRYQVVIDRFKEVAPHWQAVVVPFTIGIRGSLDESAWSQHLESLDVAREAMPRVLLSVVSATLHALDVVFDARTSVLRVAPTSE